MRIENADGTQIEELPDSLAKLLIERHDWHKTRKQVPDPEPLDLSAASDDRVEGRGKEDTPIPMTHIPGVVPGVSMNRVKKMVATRQIDVYVEGRVKKIKPSDVRAVLKQENTHG